MSTADGDCSGWRVEGNRSDRDISKGCEGQTVETGS